MAQDWCLEPNDGHGGEMSDVALRPARHGRPHRGLGSADFLLTHRRLLRSVVMNDLRQRYAGSVLGVGWAFTAPLLVLGIYAVIYLEIFRVKVPNLSSVEYV